MRKFAFNVTAWVTASGVWLSDLFFGFAVAMFSFVGANLRIAIARVGYYLMKAIDSENLERIERENDEAEEAAQHNLELKLLHAATQVRDHAGDAEDWTAHHSEAIEAIANSLVTEMGWEEEDVHAYLKPIVESIDGLHYDVFEE